MSGEIDRKVERVAALARDRQLAGIVLAARHNFSWLTAGRDNTIDASRETGPALLLIAADGRRFALANAIEAPRLSEETLASLGFDVLEFPWTEERAAPALPFARASRALAGGALGADVPTPHARAVEPDLVRLRVTLDADEVPRYRALAADAGNILETALRSVQRGLREIDVVRQIAAGLVIRAIRPIVLLAGADDRIRRFRHPLPTAREWHDRLLVALCAERHGQIVALSRMISARRDTALFEQTRANARVFEAMLRETVPGATGATVFAAAAAAYAREGFAGEEARHHQGGAIGYRSREWVAHPASTDTVGPRQAFAWNPTIAGTKVEETCLLDEAGRPEMLTASQDWPAIEFEIGGAPLPAAGVLVTG